MKRRRTAEPAHRSADTKGGSSLAKGPVAIVGLLLLAYGVLALIFGDANFDASPLDGDVQGEPFLGILGNGWTNLLFAGAGALLLLAAPLHLAAKGVSLFVGLVLGAASSIALWYGDDVAGIFAADGPTTLAWGAPAAILLVLALLPRTRGRRRKEVVEERPVAPGRDHVRDEGRSDRDEGRFGRDEGRSDRDEGRFGRDEGRSDRDEERHLSSDEEERIRRDERDRMGGGGPRP
ncbi:MAG: hypothetical protein H0U33_02120 [Solirubrobacterales bacterium]|nr:hypothetical protein [Solirubrobacterales bacterium]